MRLKLEVAKKDRSGMVGALVLDRRVKRGMEKECVGRQAASEDINLQDDFLERNGLAQKGVPIDFCGVKREGRERSCFHAGRGYALQV